MQYILKYKCQYEWYAISNNLTVAIQRDCITNTGKADNNLHDTSTIALENCIFSTSLLQPQFIMSKGDKILGILGPLFL